MNNRTYEIQLTDVAEGVIIYRHSSTEKGRSQFDTYEQALDVIGKLEGNGYVALNGATESIKYLLDVQEQYASQHASDGGEGEPVE